MARNLRQVANPLPGRGRPTASPDRTSQGSRAPVTVNFETFAGCQTRSRMVPVPRPPPQHIVTSARLLPVRSSSCTALVSRIVPVPPSGMAERDGAAVRVDLRHVGTGGALPAEHDRRERLVDLDQVDVVDREPVAFEQVLGGGDRAGEHEHRVAAHEARVDDAGPRLQPERVGLLRGHEQQRAGAVADLRRGAGGVERGIAVEHRLEVGERLERGVAQAFVAGRRCGCRPARRRRRASAPRSARPACRSGPRPTPPRRGPATACRTRRARRG